MWGGYSLENLRTVLGKCQRCIYEGKMVIFIFCWLWLNKRIILDSQICAKYGLFEYIASFPAKFAFCFLIIRFGPKIYWNQINSQVSFPNISAKIMENLIKLHQKYFSRCGANQSQGFNVLSGFFSHHLWTEAFFVIVGHNQVKVSQDPSNHSFL